MDFSIVTVVNGAVLAVGRPRLFLFHSMKRNFDPIFEQISAGISRLKEHADWIQVLYAMECLRRLA